MSERADDSPSSAPLQIALVYAAVAGLWIFVSDSLLERWVPDPGQFALVSALKGWLFIAITAVLLYGLLRRQRGHHSPLRLLTRQGLLGRLLIATLVAAGVTGATIAYTVDRNRASEVVRLEAVADLKVQQLGDWLHERATDAKLLTESIDASTLYRRWRTEGSVVSRNQLQTRLAELKRLTQFTSVSLLDESGELLWQSAGAPGVPKADAGSSLAQVARQPNPQRIGPYLDANGRVHTSIAVPLAGPAGMPAPLLVFHLDDHSYLPSRLFEWPIPSSTGEALLLRRDGDSVLYLSTLRQHPDAALRLRIPLQERQVLASQLILSGADLGVVLEGVGHDRAGAFGVGRPCPAPTGTCSPRWTRPNCTGPRSRRRCGSCWPAGWGCSCRPPGSTWRTSASSWCWPRRPSRPRPTASTPSACWPPLPMDQTTPSSPRTWRAATPCSTRPPAASPTERPSRCWATTTTRCSRRPRPGN